jgi:phosphatidylinositol alpha-1,6-mannosyltransferase
VSLPYLHSADLILGINVAYGGVIGLFARWAFGVPYATFAYAYEFLRFQRWNAARSLLLRVYGKSLVTVAISGFTRDRLTEFGAKPEKIEVIEPGAPAAREFAQEEMDAFRARFTLNGCRVILGVGRFVARKGHVTLVNAMPKILERIPNALLVLVGTGPCLSAAVNRAHALGIRENVLFPGILSEDEVSLLYRNCEVFALPTGDDGRGGVEGFGLVFTEANAYGKPVVAGRSGGVSDAVIDGETGVLVDPDQPDETAGAILSLMESPERARLLGENGRRRVETELNWSRFTERFLKAVEARSR